MNSYEIAVTDGQARSLALEVAGQETSRIFLIKLIDAALTNVNGHATGLESLNSVLNRQGFNVTCTEVADKPVRAYAEPIKKHNTVGSQVRLLRKARDWSQTELAERLGCKQTVISLLERGKKQSDDMLKRLAEVFEVEFAAFGAQTDDTPMTEKKYLGRDHPVVDRTKPRTKTSGRAQRFDEGEDDNLPSARQLQRSKVYDPVEVTGPKVLDLINFNSLSIEDMQDAFEVSSEEYEFIKTQNLGNLSPRFLHELLNDLNRTYRVVERKERPVPKLKPAQMTRTQMVSELSNAIKANPWLTKDELVHNYEFGEQDYEAILREDHLKLSVHDLREYVTHIRGAIAERNIEVDTEAK